MRPGFLPKTMYLQSQYQVDICEKCLRPVTPKNHLNSVSDQTAQLDPLVLNHFKGITQSFRRWPHFCCRLYTLTSSPDHCETTPAHSGANASTFQTVRHTETDLIAMEDERSERAAEALDESLSSHLDTLDRYLNEYQSMESHFKKVFITFRPNDHSRSYFWLIAMIMTILIWLIISSRWSTLSRLFLISPKPKLRLDLIGWDRKAMISHLTLLPRECEFDDRE